VTDTSATAAAVDRPRPAPVSRLWQRQLDRYPATGPRSFYLGIVVVATVLLYYELYIPGAVATDIIAYFGASLKYFIGISIVGNAVGALASLAAGLADRWGRANLVVFGLLITALITLFGLRTRRTRAPTWPCSRCSAWSRASCWWPRRR
jgi:hypothetical protein